MGELSGPKRLNVPQRQTKQLFGTDRKAAYHYYDWIHESDGPATSRSTIRGASGRGTWHQPRNPADEPWYTCCLQGHYDPNGRCSRRVTRSSPAFACSARNGHTTSLFDSWHRTNYSGFVSFFTGVRAQGASDERSFFIYDEPNAHPPALASWCHDPVPLNSSRRVLPISERILTLTQPPRPSRAALGDWLTSRYNVLFPEPGQPPGAFFRRGIGRSRWIRTHQHPP